MLNKDYPVKLKAIGDTVFIDSCTINDIEGTFYGAVCLNKGNLYLCSDGFMLAEIQFLTHFER